ncbi:MAG: hypothetical protein ABSA75_04370 [Candidatus Bathyarchaeia archaeon]|jgi:hypothetical protein
MKIRIIKLTPEFLVELLQGKVSSFASNLPRDAELLDLKLDLFRKQVLAIVRSDSFEDVAESYPIPEFNLTNIAESKTAPKPSATVKLEWKPEPKPTNVKPIQPSKTTIKMENEFSPEQRKLLSFTVKGDYVVVKPVQFLKAEWDDINEVVRSLGGKWVKGDIISYWEIPMQQG